MSDRTDSFDWALGTSVSVLWGEEEIPLVFCTAEGIATAHTPADVAAQAADAPAEIDLICAHPGCPLRLGYLYGLGAWAFPELTVTMAGASAFLPNGSPASVEALRGLRPVYRAGRLVAFTLMSH